MKKKINPKIFVYLIAFLFLGSMIGGALFSKPANQETNQELPLPESSILNRDFSIEEISAVVRRGMVALSFNKNACTKDCDAIDLELDRYVNRFGPYVYIAKGSSGGMLTIYSYTQEKSFDEFNSTIIEQHICNNLYVQSKPDECILMNI